MLNSRRYVRIAGPVPVSLEGSGHRAESVAVDLSRSGALIRLPGEHPPDTWERARLRVSDGGRQIIAGLIPVRKHDAIVRSGDGTAASYVFAFDSDDDEQRLERYVRTQFFSDRTAGAALDLRSLPRIECRIDVPTITVVDRDSPTNGRPAAGSHPSIGQIVNMSPDGAQLQYDGGVGKGADIELTVTVPGDSRPLILRGRVAYEIPTDHGPACQAGVAFSETMSEIDRARVRNFILSASAWGSLRSVYRRLWAGSGYEARLRIDDKSGVIRLLTIAADRGLPVNTLSEDQPVGATSSMETVADVGLVMSVDRRSVAPRPGQSLDCSFAFSGGSYYFRSTVISADGHRLSVALPDSVVFTEKRNTHRESGAVHRRWTIVLTSDGSVTVPAVALDSSSGGISLQVIDPPDHSIEPGAAVTLYPEGSPDAEGRVGEIRNVELHRDSDGVRYRLGVEFGTLRREPWTQVLDADEYATIPLDRDRLSVGDCQVFESQKVEFAGADGRPIVALINATSLNAPATVVIIPPAFGKRKEALAPLAATLLATFRAAGRSVVVIRFDGTDRPGESANRLANAARGYEMLDYTISQGRSDLEAAIRYAIETPLFAMERLALVTFSMSSLDARRLLADSPLATHVALWISVMGVPAAKNALIQTMGGLDVVSNYTAGLPSGVCGLLGHLLDMDQVAADLIANRYAYLTDARADMARIDIPVVWIYGTHDRWVQSEEVADVMSVRAGAPRAVIQIPAGHNLRTSDDAQRTFRMIAMMVLRGSVPEIAADGVVAATERWGRVPLKDEMLALITYERERLSNRSTMENLDEYWRRYLIGSGADRAGYDFYGQLKPFVDFLREEVEMLAPQPGDSILDAGCGTGLFLQTLVTHLTQMKPSFTGRVVACDLVPAAAERARAKVDRVQRDAQSNIPVEYRVLDLEPNRLIPLVRYLDSPEWTIDSLRGRIEGLSSEVVRELSHVDQTLVRQIVTGRTRADDADTGLTPHALAVLGELARATDYVRGARETAAVPVLRHLRFTGAERDLRAPFDDAEFDAIMASLFISYLFNPDYLLEDFHRALRPGGRLVVSSMRPDSDISVIFTDYVAHADASGAAAAGLAGARQMLSEAAALFELEEEGFFQFYSEEELTALVAGAGFEVTDVRRTLGNPYQAVVVAGRKR